MKDKQIKTIKMFTQRNIDNLRLLHLQLLLDCKKQYDMEKLNEKDMF